MTIFTFLAFDTEENWIEQVKVCYDMGTVFSRS